MSKWLLGAGCTAFALCLLAGCTCVEFSPDGKQIVFSWSTRAHKNSLYVVNVDGTGFHPLPGGADGMLASWSPDGRYLLFDAQQNSQKQQASQQPDVTKIYDAQTGHTQVIASGVDVPFAWRADSRQFAAIGGMAKQKEVRIYHVPGGSLISRVPLPVSIQGIEPLNGQMLWLPNSDSIAFFGDNAQGHDIYNVEGDQVRPITTTHDVIGYGLSADGQRLVWARSITSGGTPRLALWSSDLATRSVSRLSFPRHLPVSDTRRAPQDISYATFSPDGQRMALMATLPASHRRTGKHKPYTTIYTIRLDGTDLRQIQRANKDEDVLIPSWSHDGKRLAVLQAGENPPLSISTMPTEPARCAYYCLLCQKAR